MDSDASSSGTVAVSWHNTHGICYHRQHVRRCLRTKMGWLDTIRLVGHVVARRRTHRCLLPLATFPDVS